MTFPHPNSEEQILPVLGCLQDLPCLLLCVFKCRVILGNTEMLRSGCFFQSDVLGYSKVSVNEAGQVALSGQVI